MACSSPAAAHLLIVSSWTPMTAAAAEALRLNGSGGWSVTATIYATDYGKTQAPTAERLVVHSCRVVLWTRAGVYGIMRDMKRPTLSQQEDRARRALRTLMGVLDLTDEAVAERLGWSRQRVQQRRNGDTRIRMGDAEELAEAIGVDPLVFGLDPLDLLQYLVNEHPDLVVARCRCSVQSLVA